MAEEQRWKHWKPRNCGERNLALEGSGHKLNHTIAWRFRRLVWHTIFNPLSSFSDWSRVCQRSGSNTFQRIISIIEQSNIRLLSQRRLREWAYGHSRSLERRSATMPMPLESNLSKEWSSNSDLPSPLPEINEQWNLAHSELSFYCASIYYLQQQSYFEPLAEHIATSIDHFTDILWHSLNVNIPSSTFSHSIHLPRKQLIYQIEQDSAQVICVVAKKKSFLPLRRFLQQHHKGQAVIAQPNRTSWTNISFTYHWVMPTDKISWIQRQIDLWWTRGSWVDPLNSSSPGDRFANIDTSTARTSSPQKYFSHNGLGTFLKLKVNKAFLDTTNWTFLVMTGLRLCQGRIELNDTRHPQLPEA